MLMLALNTQKGRKMGLYASPIAILGLGSSILSGNEDGFILRVSVAQQKALLLFASALAMRALYIGLAMSVSDGAGNNKLVLRFANRARSLTQPGESRSNRPAESNPPVAERRRRTERGIWLWTESVVI